MAVSGTDTGVLTMSANGDAYPFVSILVSCRWVGAGAAGDQCLLTDTSGETLFFSEANGANYTDGWAFDRKWVSGLVVATMDSGTLQVYMSSK